MKYFLLKLQRMVGNCGFELILGYMQYIFTENYDIFTVKIYSF